MDNLEPITPTEALELYIEYRRNEVSAATLRSHKSRLGHFVRWCEQEDLDNLNDLTGRRLHKFRIWRRNLNGISKVTEKTQMDTLRVFVRFLETIDAVTTDLHTKVQSPNVTPDENTRDEILRTDRAEAVLTHLEKYQYASREHVTLALLWHSMMRRGAVRALDLRDYHPDEQYIEVLHRPETGTPIKNKTEGERMVALSDQMCELLDDWIATVRPDVMDEHGREPLITTAQGRIHVTTVQQYVYRFTRPCIYTVCPHDRNPDDCEGARRDSASKCPSSVSPHAIRRGAITFYLESGMPEKAVGDRANVSQEVLDQHYDRRSERDKMEQRREFLDDI
ncbi:tyrosine-type recombinase/integrase [Saliphagus sp. GCM10025308]